MRGENSERQWNIFFYLCNSKNTDINALYLLFNKEWTKKTLRRDLEMLERFGVRRTRNQLGDRWHYDGDKRPFIKRPGEKYCVSCRDFKKVEEFGTKITTIDTLKHQCIKCHTKQSKASHLRNYEFNVKKRRKRFHELHPETEIREYQRIKF